MKVAAIQMVSSTALDDNLRVARELLEQAALGGAELAVLPEDFCLMGYKAVSYTHLTMPTIYSV